MKRVLETYPYQRLYEQLRIWGKKWKIGGVSKFPDISEIREALAVSLAIQLSGPCCLSGAWSSLNEKAAAEINNGFKFFEIREYLRDKVEWPGIDGQVEEVDIKTRIMITYKATRGRSFPYPRKQYQSHPGVIVYRLYKDGRVKY